MIWNKQLPHLHHFGSFIHVSVTVWDKFGGDIHKLYWLKCLLTASSNGGNGCLQSELCINICRWCIGCRRFFWLISQGLISLQVLHSWDTWGGSHVWLGVGQLWKVIEEFLAFVPVPISSPATCVKDSSQLKHLGSSVISEPDWMLNWKPKSVSYFCAHGLH